MAKRRNTRRTKKHNKKPANRRLRFSDPLDSLKLKPVIIPKKERRATQEIFVAEKQIPVFEPQETGIQKPKNKKILLTTKTIDSHNKKITICVRRRQRNQIIHAINKSGQSGQKKPDMQNSKIKC